MGRQRGNNAASSASTRSQPPTAATTQPSTTSASSTTTASTAPGNSSHASTASSSPLPSVPSVSVPKGGGALQGMGDRLTTSLATGTSTISIPVPTSPGRGSLGADITLGYDSGSGNGIFGLGWMLSMSSISRRTDKGLPQYLDPTGPDSDTFVISGSDDLVPVLIAGPPSSPNSWTRPAPSTQTSNAVDYYVYRYRPRIEGSFTRIELWCNARAPTTDMHWRSTSADNVLSIYGLDSNSRIVDPANPLQIFQWLLCQQHDRGNALVVKYKAEDSINVPTTISERNRTDTTRASNRHIKSISYGNFTSTLTTPDLSLAQWHFQVVFDYGEHDSAVPTPAEVNPWLCRNDPFSTHKPRFEVRSYRLCQRILIFHNFPREPNVGADCLVRSLNFVYRDNAQKGSQNISFLASVTTSGYQRSGTTYLSASLPPMEFRYSDAVISSTIQSVDPTSLENLPAGLDQSAYKWVDLEAEGISGILTEQASSWFYKHNLGDGKFGPMQLVPAKPSVASAAPGSTQHLMDLAGDGRLDIVNLGPGIPGFSKRSDSFADGWDTFTSFSSFPNINWTNPNLQLVDVTGDGLADGLIIAPDCLIAYQSLGEDGFMTERRWYPPSQQDEEQGPLLIYADQKHTVFLADMSGDGLTDLVRIRNGEACYWPSEGYGRFGAKVTMEQCPWFENPDLFDPRRIRLGDIDGSGTTDIVYLSASGSVDVYLNYSGNVFAPPNRLPGFLPVDNIVTVTLIDLLGKGTDCLMWSSSFPSDTARRISYIDLVEGPKPHLLTSYVNNMGSETIVTYAPSTKFYLEDKAAGNPWITRLPFPTQVVERVEKLDHISNTYFSTRYVYHHGYYDGVERELRGFGCVDQHDTEEYSLSDSSSANVDKSSWLPPVLTKTWYHTGARVQGVQISDSLVPEYYFEPGGLSDGEKQAMLLPDSVLPTSLAGYAYSMTDNEFREATRALKGLMLRQEVYTLDGTAQEKEPYSVVQKNYTIQILQPQGINRYMHGVFLSSERESVSFSYDRYMIKVNGKDIPDPRPTHTLNLSVDEWGHSLQALTVAYGRRHADTNTQLTNDDRTKQQQALLTMTVNQYTNAVDTVGEYRTPVVCDTQTFEVINFPVTTSRRITPLVRFSVTFPKIQSLLPGNFDIPFEDWTHSTAVAGQISRRMLSHNRVIFRKDDFTGPLPLGQIEALALPYDTYTQVLTAGLVKTTYVDTGKLVAGDVESKFSIDCSLVHSEGDTNWWTRTGNVFYSPNSDSTPAQERAHAEQHFYMVRRFRDVFYSETSNTEVFVTYDSYDLLVIETVDPYGNRITAGIRDATNPSQILQLSNDYRVLAPVLVMDPNRNRTAVTYDDLGRLTAQAVMGKPEEFLGDTLSSVKLRLSDSEILEYFNDPLANPASILGSATSRVIYDTLAYYNTKTSPTPQPVRIASLDREVNVSDLTTGTQSRIQHVITYINGFVKEFQGVAQAEPDPTTATLPRWIVSGWIIYNNKGDAIKKYEPFFSSTPQYQPNTVTGVSKLIMYDPIGRIVANLLPNHTWSKTIYRSWSQEAWDLNDTILISDPREDPDVGDYFSRIPDSSDYLPSWYDARISGSMTSAEAAAAAATAIHAGTPTLSFLDPMGRVIVTVAHNRYQRSTEISPTQLFSSSRAVFDISGATRQSIDSNGRLIEIHDVDMAGNIIHRSNMESGEVWTLNSVAAKDVSTWNSRGFRTDTTYDLIQREVQVHVQQNTGLKALAIKTEYGDTQTNAEAKNLRTKAISVSDQSGTTILASYDYKGNLLNGTKTLVGAYSSIVDWSASTVPMEPGQYPTRFTYDALNRTLRSTGPDGSMIRNAYGIEGLLQTVQVNLQGTSGWQPVLQNVSYNAKGQRVLGITNNGVKTVYKYDPLTFKMTDVVTSRNASKFPNDCPQPPVPGWSGCQIQSLHYTFDPTGNITNIRDDAQQTIFFQNKRVEPSSDYVYDSLYRVVEATGREHLGQTGVPTPYGPSTAGDARQQSPSNGNAMGTYMEQYFLDNVGNLQSVKHTRSDVTQQGWTRMYKYEESSMLRSGDISNRLTSTSVGDVTDQYSYSGIDGMTGNIMSMPHLSFIQYDYCDHLQGTATQRVNSGTPQTTWYSYDSSGQRIRKLTVAAATSGAKPIATAERIYIGPFEIYREFSADGTTSLERQSLHVMNADDRIAIIETRTVGTDPGLAQQFRYQYGNHLGSVSLELDGQADIVSYEEFYPYGSTSYQATASQTETPKRYRYVGKELDSENGFYFYGARYYAPWLGRWTSTDPAGISVGVNLYEYSRSNPIVFLDPDGSEPENYYRAQGRPGKQAFGFFLGNAAHKLIAYHYKYEHPGNKVFTNSVDISTILKKSGAGDPSKLLPGEGSLKPDIADTTVRGLLEIKPWGKNADEHEEWREEGRNQVNGYLDALNRAAPAKRQFSLMTGENGELGIRFLGGKEYWRLRWATTEAGVAQYKWERLKRNDIRRLSDQQAFYANEYEDVSEADAAQYGQQLNDDVEWMMKWRGRLDSLRDAVGFATHVIGSVSVAILGAAMSAPGKSPTVPKSPTIGPTLPPLSPPVRPGLPLPGGGIPKGPMPGRFPIPPGRPQGPSPSPMMMGQ